MQQRTEQKCRIAVRAIVLTASNTLSVLQIANASWHSEYSAAQWLVVLAAQ
jgi:hypothetical protein